MMIEVQLKTVQYSLQLTTEWFRLNLGDDLFGSLLTTFRITTYVGWLNQGNTRRMQRNAEYSWVNVPLTQLYLTLGVNLRSFYQHLLRTKIPEAQKDSQIEQLFALLGPASVKAVCKIHWWNWPQVKKPPTFHVSWERRCWCRRLNVGEQLCSKEWL